MFKSKVSILVFLMVVLFISFNIFGYFLIKNNFINNNQDKNKVIFYKSKLLASNLINKLIYEYEVQSDILIKKHLEVEKYLDKINDFKNLDLTMIYDKINKGLKNKPYDIYISDENLLIENTTFKDDLGFDLSFSKDIFDKHKKEHTIIPSAPNFENISKLFFSYTDSYIKDTKRILQVSYKYFGTQKLLDEMKNLILKNKNLVQSNAYVVFKNGYIGNFIFTDKYKISDKILKEDSKKARKLLKKLKNNDFVVKSEGVYKKVYFLGDSEIFPSNKILFSLVLDDSALYEKLAILRYNIFFLILFGLIFIYYIFIARNKEILLKQKDEFIRCSMHEIKTPLSIISLNNQLRDKIYGVDKYSCRISYAIKNLQNSYNDMVFSLTNAKQSYKKKNINLNEFLKERILFFKDFANIQAKNIYFKDLDKSIYIYI